MQVWLITTTEHTSAGYCADERVRTYEREREALQFIGAVASGEELDAIDNEIKIQGVHLVDTTCGTIKRLEPALVNFKLVLKEQQT